MSLNLQYPYFEYWQISSSILNFVSENQICWVKLWLEGRRFTLPFGVRDCSSNYKNHVEVDNLETLNVKAKEKASKQRENISLDKTLGKEDDNIRVYTSNYNNLRANGALTLNKSKIDDTARQECKISGIYKSKEARPSKRKLPPPPPPELEVMLPMPCIQLCEDDNTTNKLRSDTKDKAKVSTAPRPSTRSPTLTPRQLTLHRTRPRSPPSCRASPATSTTRTLPGKNGDFCPTPGTSRKSPMINWITMSMSYHNLITKIRRCTNYGDKHRSMPKYRSSN